MRCVRADDPFHSILAKQKWFLEGKLTSLQAFLADFFALDVSSVLIPTFQNDAIRESNY